MGWETVGQYYYAYVIVNLSCYFPHRHLDEKLLYFGIKLNNDYVYILGFCLPLFLALIKTCIIRGNVQSPLFPFCSPTPSHPFQIFPFFCKGEPFVARGKPGISFEMWQQEMLPICQQANKCRDMIMFLRTLFMYGFLEENFNILYFLFFSFRNYQLRTISRHRNFSFWVLLQRSVEAQEV